MNSITDLLDLEDSDIIISDISIQGTNKNITLETRPEYYGAAEPPVRCGESHLSGLTEPLRSL